MIETVFSYSLEDERKVEKLIDADEVMINHMIFPKDAGLPEHNANSNVYMVILRGTLTLQLADQEPHRYGRGSIVNIPYGTRMNVSNRDEAVLEMFVIKAPTPAKFEPAH